MARYGLAGALIATAVIVTACGGDDSTTSSTSTTQEPALGAPIEFQRADSGETVGTIRIHEAVMVPAECLAPGDQALAVRVELDNPGDLFLPAPDEYTLTTVDAEGITRQTGTVTLNLECEPDYPEPARSDPRSKTEGWEILKVQGVPAAIVYAPIVAEPDSTIDNMKYVPVAPESAKVALPGLATAPPPLTTTVTPTTTEAPPPPPVVIETQEISYPEAGDPCDTSTDTWAVDSAGGQLRCAFAGGPTSKWVNSAPFVGIREEGAPCDTSESGVAETADGTPMVCVGSRGDSVWMPGP